MSFELVRYFDLSGAVDADPLVAQPTLTTVTAVTGPLKTSKVGRTLFNAWEVDVAGRRVTPTVGLTVTIGVVTWSTVRADALPSEWPPVGATTQMEAGTGFWGRGQLSSSVTPGQWQAQAELPGVVGYQVVVTAKSASPLNRWLAIWAVQA